MNFSILLSIYKKEIPNYFNRAMISIWDEQILKPSEIILVKDGPLTSELNNVIKVWEEKLDGLFKIIELPQNVGLGEALNIGLKHCRYELVARMDTDDIAKPRRFLKQIREFKENKVDMVGSTIAEFNNDENKVARYKSIPIDYEAIYNYSKKRNPFNHPSVMYKKSVVQKVGGYKKMKWFEDYYLWIRILKNGYKCKNIEECLLKMRIGNGQITRRRGLQYAKAEFNFQSRIYNEGFLNFFEFLTNLTIRIPIRLLPIYTVNRIYEVIRR